MQLISRKNILNIPHMSDPCFYSLERFQLTVGEKWTIPD